MPRVSDLPHGAGQRVVAGDLKACTNCGDVLALEAFAPARRVTTGRSSWCRSCNAQRTRIWRAQHPDYDRRYRAARRRPLPAHACPGCGRAFVPRRSDAVYCSPRCRAAVRQRRIAAGRPARFDFATGRWAVQPVLACPTDQLGGP